MLITKSELKKWKAKVPENQDSKPFTLADIEKIYDKMLGKEDKMKETSVVYRCDNCNTILSKDDEGKKHLSINFGKHSGWVDKFLADDYVRFDRWLYIKPEIIWRKHFCDGKCLAHYVEVKIFSQARNG